MYINNIGINIVQQEFFCINIKKHRPSTHKRLYKPIYGLREICFYFTYQLIFISNVEERRTIYFFFHCPLL